MQEKFRTRLLWSFSVFIFIFIENGSGNIFDWMFKTFSSIFFFIKKAQNWKQKTLFSTLLEVLLLNVMQPLLQPCHLVPVSEYILMLELSLANSSSNPVTSLVVIGSSIDSKHVLFRETSLSKCKRISICQGSSDDVWIAGVHEPSQLIVIVKWGPSFRCQVTSLEDSVILLVEDHMSNEAILYFENRK